MVVSIIIPLYNEQANIVRLLDSIKSQKLPGGSIQHVYIYDDCSTDKSYQCAQDLLAKDVHWVEKATLMQGTCNRGKAHALNILIKRVNRSSDVIVFLDSDLELDNSYIIQNLIQPLKDNKVGLTGGYYYFSGKGYLRNVYSFSLRLLSQAGKVKPIYISWGGLMAMRTQLAKKLVLPETLFRTDAFMYMYTIANNYRFVASNSVQIRDNKDFSTLGLKGFARVQARTNTFPEVFYEFFTQQDLDKELYLSVRQKAYILLRTLIAHPVEGFTYVVCRSYALIWNRLSRTNGTHLWRS